MYHHSFTLYRLYVENKKYFKKIIYRGGCLLTKNGDSSVPNVADPTPRLADPNNVCRRSQGADSYLYHVCYEYTLVITYIILDGILW